jgi:hypothetical protein
MLPIYKTRRPRKPAVKGFKLNLRTAEGKRIYEARTWEMALAQGCQCAICGLLMVNPTFDHALGRGHGGGHRDDRSFDEQGNQINAALCARCNSAKGSQRYEWRGGIYAPVIKEVA